MTDTSNTAPYLKVDLSYNPKLRVVNPATGKPDDRIVVAATVLPVGFSGRAAAALPIYVSENLDVSGSMDQPMSETDRTARMVTAKIGLEEWVRRLRPGNYFSMSVFGSTYRRAYPVDHNHKDLGPCVADASTIAGASKVVKGLGALNESTKVAGVFRQFRKDLIALAGKVSFSYLFLKTDGRFDDPDSVNEEIALLKAMKTTHPFLVIVFGVSDQWNFDQLKVITDELGSEDPIHLSTAEQVQKTFAKLAAVDADLSLRSVTMIVDMAKGTKLIGAECSRPIVRDFLALNQVTYEGERVARINLGPWGSEAREFLVELQGSMPSTGQASFADISFECIDGVNHKTVSDPNEVEGIWTRNASASAVITPEVQRALGDRATKVRMMEAGAAAEKGDERSAAIMLLGLYETAEDNNDQEAMDKMLSLIEVSGAKGSRTARLKEKGNAAALAIKARGTRVRSMED